MDSHVPNKGVQTVRYDGHYSNLSRGRRKQKDQNDQIPSFLEPDEASPEYRQTRGRFIQKIYEDGMIHLHVSTTKSCGRILLYPQEQIPYDRLPKKKVLSPHPP